MQFKPLISEEDILINRINKCNKLHSSKGSLESIDRKFYVCIAKNWNSERNGRKTIPSWVLDYPRKKSDNYFFLLEISGKNNKNISLWGLLQHQLVELWRVGLVVGFFLANNRKNSRTQKFSSVIFLNFSIYQKNFLKRSGSNTGTAVTENFRHVSHFWLTGGICFKRVGVMVKLVG